MQKVKSKVPTGFPVLLVLSVESMHSLQQLPLLAAARVIDKVLGENLFQLSDGEVLYRLFIVQIRQRGPDPPLCRRTDLQSTQEMELRSVNQRHDWLFLKASLNYKNFCTSSIKTCSVLCMCKKKEMSYVYNIFSGRQVQEGRCWSILMLLCEKSTH